MIHSHNDLYHSKKTGADVKKSERRAKNLIQGLKTTNAETKMMEQDRYLRRRIHSEKELNIKWPRWETKMEN